METAARDWLEKTPAATEISWPREVVRMELDCSDKKIYRLIFDRQEITSGVTHRAHRSLWAHFKVNPGYHRNRTVVCGLPNPGKPDQNWFDLFNHVWGKEKAFSGRQPKRRQRNNKTLSL